MHMKMDTREFRDHELTYAMGGKKGGAFRESNGLQQGLGHTVGVNQDI